MGRTTVMLGFSVPPPLAEEVEIIAKEEHRTKSELFREMWRVYRAYRRNRQREEEERRWIDQIIDEAQEDERQHPRSIEEKMRSFEELARYGEAQAKKMGIETEEDIERVIKEYRAERRQGA